MTFSSAAAQARRAKDKRPALYCSHERCLWRVVNSRTGKVTPCPKHPTDRERIAA